MPLQWPFVHHIPLQGPFVYHMPLRGLFLYMYLFRGIYFLCVLLFRKVMSFGMIGIPRFKRILYSFTNCPSGISIHVGAFAARICDFVTFFVSINAFGI